jgi:protocatechuate 3,4-dioxygenase beta subunit
MIFFFIVLFSGLMPNLFAQNDSLLSEVTAKLKSGREVSSILTDKKYDKLHPETSFRDLIKKYSSAKVLSIATDTIPGKKIKVIGCVKNKEGKSIAGALVYLYHTDTRGWYAADAPHVMQNEGDFRHARLFGYVKTDKEGKFELHTIKPSGYPKSDLPAHIHVHVMADGYSSNGTEFLFDDDTRLVGKIREDAMRNNFMIAKPERSAAPFEQQFSYTMVLEKN